MNNDDDGAAQKNSKPPTGITACCSLRNKTASRQRAEPSGLLHISSSTLCTSEMSKGRGCPRKATRVLFLGEGLEQGRCAGLLLRSRRNNKERSRGRKGKIAGAPWTGTLGWGSACSLEEEKREEGWTPWAGSSCC